MSSGFVCRVCLVGNMKLSPMESIPLLNIYERITCIQFNKDKRRSGFCPFCYQKLLKCYTFFAMAWRAENLFDQLLLLGVREFETKLKLGVTQHMTVAPMQSINIDSSTSYGPAKKMMKEEPNAVVKEEYAIIVKSEALCRICLAGNLTLNPMESIQLQDIYHKLTNSKFNSEDSRPRAACPFCYQKLLKCYIFSKIACRSEKLFDQLLLNSYKQVTNKLVTQLKLRVKQHMVVTCVDSITIDSATCEPFSLTIKEEPIPKEDYTNNNQTENSGILILEECIRRGLTEQNLPTKFLCTVCGKNYDTETRLKKHMYLHKCKEKFICKVCNKELQHKHSLIKHMLCHSGVKEFACTVCNKEFRHMHHLKPHMRTHTGEQPFPCTVCQRRFNEKSHLNRHILLHSHRKEPTEKNFPCKECHRKFSTKHNLSRHMRVHTGDKPFPCSVCQKRYQTKYNLTVHMLYHNRDKPRFACSLCDKKFYHKSHLVTHLRNHNAKEPKFKCRVCHEQCTQKQHLITHMRLLHPGKRLYACDDCNKEFNKKAHLIRHMNSHIGKQYSCDLCDTKFNHKDSIIGHMRIHTRETPYGCTLCKIKFTQKKLLKTHIRKKHEVKSEYE